MSDSVGLVTVTFFVLLHTYIHVCMYLILQVDSEGSASGGWLTHSFLFVCLTLLIFVDGAQSCSLSQKRKDTSRNEMYKTFALMGFKETFLSVISKINGFI